jgi:hypothetical protein
VLETAAFRTLVKNAEKTGQIKYGRTKTGNEVLDGQKVVAF